MKSHLFQWIGVVSLVGALAACQPALNALETLAPEPSPEHYPSHATPEDSLNTPGSLVSLNRRDLPWKAGEPLRLLVVGHLYGSTEVDDRLPAQSFLDQIPAINDLGLTALVSLGDMVKHSEEDDFDQLDEVFLSQVSFPVFNTVGNHDVENRPLYESWYGQTYYSFEAAGARLIFLDTERENCGLDAVQQNLLHSAVQDALAKDEIHSILIFMHKTLFFKNEALAEARSTRGSPNVWDCYQNGNFVSAYQDLLIPAAQSKPIYLFAGDVGAFSNLSPYYQLDANGRITQVMTGLGDSEGDAGILATVTDGQVTLQLHPLTGGAFQPLEAYTPEYWAAQK